MSSDRQPTDQDKRRFLQQLTLALGAGALAVAAPPALSAGASGPAAASSTDLMEKLAGTSLRDRLTTPQSADYDSARRIYDLRADKRPLAIAYCTTVAEVATVLGLVQSHGMPFAVRSGGHGFTGRSTIDGGVLIDLSRMNRITVAADGSSVTVEPGARTAEVLAKTSAIGKAPVTPTDGHIGLVGAALFSGQGYLSRLHGNACDNVTSATVMLASGKIVTASPRENQDLFWAIRGAGDSFGIVLSMDMKLHDIPATPMLCSITYGMDDAVGIMKRFRDHRWTSPIAFPLGGFDIDPATRAPRLSYLIILLGTDAENQRELDAIAAYGKPVFSDIRKVSWLEAHTALPLPSGKRFYIAGCETDLQDDVSMNLMLGMIESARKLPPTQGDMTGPIVFFFPNDEGFARQPEFPAAYGLRGGFEIECLASWDNPAHDSLFEGWADESAARVAKAGLAHRPPVIANTRVDVSLMRQSFGKSYRKLVRIKRKYDPKGRFGATTVIEV